MIPVIGLDQLDRTRPRQATATQVRQAVESIIQDVAQSGDAALIALTRKLDGITLDAGSFWVNADAMAEAWRSTEPEIKDALAWAWDNVQRFHSHETVATSWQASTPTCMYGQKISPLGRVGIYVPGGKFPYPSTVIMAAAPARVAGVGDLVVASPPQPGGLPHQLVLAAAHLVGRCSVLALGGAQAIAALALGTESVAAVDKVVGPGNSYVQEAKRQLYGRVGVDMLAGPSEVAVVAEAGTCARTLALDLLAQAEHGPGGRIVLLTPSQALAQAVSAELSILVSESPDPENLTRFLESGTSLIVTAPDLDSCVAAAGQLESEHVLLATRSPHFWLERLDGGASVYLGINTPPAYGDYGGGPTHVLPTGGSAAFSSGLSTADFLRRQNYLEAIQPPPLAPEALARAEGLWAHASSLAARRPDPIPLHANESRIPLPPRVQQEALAQAAAVSWQTYPPVRPQKLLRSLGTYTGLDPDQILTGAGSDELILAAALALRKLRWLVVWPGFWVYPRVLGWVGVEPELVPLAGDDFSLPTQRLLELVAQSDPATTVLVIINPNNPTGNLFPAAELQRLLETGAWLLLDEAYWEFAGVTMAGDLARFPRLMILRTLSKAFGLAGLRVGYMLAHGNLIQQVGAHRLPLSVSTHSLEAAAAVVDGHAEVLEGVQETVTERQRMADRLSELGLRAYDSRTNFILVDVGDGAAVHAELAAAGYLVRKLNHIPELANCIRITVGRRSDNEGLLTALDGIVSERSR